MCLGIPGRIVEITDPANYLAKVDVSGVQRTISVRLLESDMPEPDDWVLVHVGFAMAKIDETEALLDPGRCQEARRGLHHRSRGLRLVGDCLREATMKFVDEFRDPAAARKLLAAIEHLAGSGSDHFKFMEVCGGHTHTIYRHGIEHLLPDNVELVHGPGCPVCVIPMGRIDDAMWLAGQPDVIFTCFGDMMRVPGSAGSSAGRQGTRRRCPVRLLPARRAQGR